MTDRRGGCIRDELRIRGQQFGRPRATPHSDGEIKVLRRTRRGPLRDADSTDSASLGAEAVEHLAPSGEDAVLLGSFDQRELATRHRHRARESPVTAVAHDADAAGVEELEPSQEGWERRLPVAVGGTPGEERDRCCPVPLDEEKTEACRNVSVELLPIPRAEGQGHRHGDGGE